MQVTVAEIVRNPICHAARSGRSINGEAIDISLVVTVSSVSRSAEAAQCPDWLWERDNVQSASAATDCREIQPILLTAC